MRTREERQADRQERRQDRRDRRQERRANRGEAINNLLNTVTGQTPPPAAVPTITPPTPPTPETETPVVDPQKEELSRQAREVMSGNVNPAQAEYFRQQNEELFMRERKGANPTNQKELFMARERKGVNPTNIYNKLEEITGVNPVSNRRNDKMNELFGGLYGSEESRGF
jgi:hypothetical protein